MKTNHQLKGDERFYSPLILALLLAAAFISFSAVNLRPAPRTGGVQLNPVIQKVQQIYTSQIGIREKHNNSGPQVEDYLRYVNLSKGNPWCAAFVCWVYGKAGVGNPRSGWSPDLFGEGRVIWWRGEPGTKSQVPRHLQSVTGDQGTRSKEQRLPPNVLGNYASSQATGNWQLVTPGTGDIFGLFFPEKARIAHVGFIDKWDGTWLITVEGNTNITGSREGDGVYRKRRAVRSVYKVARYIK